MGWFRRLRSTIAGSRLDRDLDAEARFHLEQRIEEYVRRGMTVAEAWTQAIRRFGNVTLTQERTRDVDTFRWVHDLRQDLPLALRLLVKSPGFTATVVLSLAVGIGTNAAVFGAIDALILRRLPVRNPEQLVMFGPPDTYAIDYPLLERLRGLSSVFDGISAIVMTDRFGIAVSTADSGIDAGVAVHLVTGNYFPLMGTTAAIGRNLTPDDDRAGSQAVAVVSYAYWERRLARAPDVVGRTLRTNGTTFTIVGVAQRGFAGDRTGRPADVWIPTVMEPQIMPGCRVLRCGAEVRIIGRLRAGVAIPHAQAAARVVADQFNREAYPSSPQQVSPPQLKLQSAAGGYTPQLDSLAQSLIILMVVVGCVLMIACANIANLLLVRSAARQREMALRLALGAGRARIVRQLLAESLLLALTGGALGSLFAVWGMRILATALSSGPAVGVLQSRISLDAHVDARVLAFTVAICLLTGVLFGLAPAFRSSRASL
jgi:predicted permease